MTEAVGYLAQLLGNLRKVRLAAGIDAHELEERLILGLGWINRFESGETVPGIDLLLIILNEMGASIGDLLKGLPEPEATSIDRCIFAEADGDDLMVHFRYAKFDARYQLPKANLDQFEEVLKALRDGLANLQAQSDDVQKAIKREAVVACYFKAVEFWPHANPSDLWWFIVSRAYCDPYNHPVLIAAEK